jgi:hypothetical protein
MGLQDPELFAIIVKFDTCEPDARGKRIVKNIIEDTDPQRLLVGSGLWNISKMSDINWQWTIGPDFVSPNFAKGQLSWLKAVLIEISQNPETLLRLGISYMSVNSDFFYID